MRVFSGALTSQLFDEPLPEFTIKSYWPLGPDTVGVGCCGCIPIMVDEKQALLKMSISTLQYKWHILLWCVSSYVYLQVAKEGEALCMLSG